jgi:hypothetical protein
MQNQKEFNQLSGQTITWANSSLKNFSLRFDSNLGLIVNAVDGPAVDANIVDSEALPQASDAVCSVDWSWIYGSTIKSIGVQNGLVRLILDPVGPVLISCAVWQGSPFLSFQPYKAPGR